jgi:hypothetical protein
MISDLTSSGVGAQTLSTYKDVVDGYVREDGENPSSNDINEAWWLASTHCLVGGVLVDNVSANAVSGCYRLKYGMNWIDSYDVVKDDTHRTFCSYPYEKYLVVGDPLRLFVDWDSDVKLPGTKLVDEIHLADLALVKSKPGEVKWLYHPRMFFSVEALGREVHKFQQGVIQTEELARVCRLTMMNKAKYDGQVYYDLGASYASVLDATRLGVKYVGYGRTRAPMSLMNGLELEASDVARVESRGQDKLLAVDLPLLSLSMTVVVVGGSPGEHFNLFRNHRIINFDPRPPRYQCEWREKLFGGEDDWKMLMGLNERFVFIDDSRSDVSDPSNRREVLNADHERKLVWMARLMQCDNCIAFSFKVSGIYRDITLYKNVLYVFEPFSASTSTEVRGIWHERYGRDPHSLMILSDHEYVSRLRYWNKHRLAPGAEWEQAVNIATMFVHNEDFLVTKPWRSITDGVVCAFFSIGDIRNDRQTALRCLKDLIAYDGHAIITYDTMYGSEPQGGYQDHVFTWRDLSGMRYMSVYDYMCSYAPFINNDWSYGFDGRSEHARPWAYVRKWNHSDGFQTVSASQTGLVRVITSILKNMFHSKFNALHEVRQYVISKLFALGTYTFVDHKRVNAVLTGKKPVAISVAGHLINMMVISHYLVVDISTYLSTIRANVASFAGDRDIKRELGFFYKKGVIAEASSRSRFRLWHGYWDFVCAVHAYKFIMSRMLRVEPDTELIKFVLENLLSIYQDYSFFNSSGFQGKDYLRGFDVTRDGVTRDFSQLINEFPSEWVA